MQFARTPVVIKTIRRVGLLLSFDQHRASADGMYRSARDIDHLALIDVDPVQQFFSPLFANRLLELRGSDASLQSQSDLRTGLGMGHVPALCLPPRLAETLSR